MVRCTQRGAARLGAILALSAITAGACGATPVKAGWSELHRSRAWRVVVVEGVSVLLEPGFNHLTGLGRDGKERWRVPASGAVFAIPPEAWPAGRAVQREKAGRFVLLDARDGSTRSQLQVKRAHATVWRTEHGGFIVLDGRELRLHDAQGKLLHRRKLPAEGGLSVGDTLLGLNTESAVLLYRRDTLAPAGQIKGRFKVVALGGTIGRDRLLLHERLQKHEPGLVLLLARGVHSASP